MSCRDGQVCGGQGSSPSRSGHTPSHRTIHISMEKSPTRTGEFPSYPEYSGIAGNIRMPCGARTSPGPYSYPGQFDQIGAPMDYNMSWMPKDVNLAELLDQSAGQMSARFRRMDPNLMPGPSQPPPVPDAELSRENSLLEREQRERNETSPDGSPIDKKTQESLIQWFDRSVEKELKKHKESSMGAMLNLAQPPLDADTLPELNLSKGTLERLAEATASQVEICLQLRKEPDTELADAVEKLAKAEAMCAFAGAVQAAEAAAEAAPPELAEEAAVASARGFQTEVATSSFHQSVGSYRPIEVLGYVGITKPKFPTRRK